MWNKKANDLYLPKSLQVDENCYSKLLNCRVNMTYFVKNHEIFFNYFEENEKQIPWKHSVCYDCETCNSYFAEHTMT